MCVCRCRLSTTGGTPSQVPLEPPADPTPAPVHYDAALKRLRIPDPPPAAAAPPSPSPNNSSSTLRAAGLPLTDRYRTPSPLPHPTQRRKPSEPARTRSASDEITAAWSQSGVDRIHTMTWGDGSKVVTYWRPSETPGDGLTLHMIGQIGR